MKEFDYRNILNEKLNVLALHLAGDTDGISESLELDFIKSLAFEAQDIELLGLCANIEMKFSDVLSNNFDDYLSNIDEVYSHSYKMEENNYTVFHKKIHDAFFLDGDFYIDMSVYQEEVERNKDALIRHGLYGNLSKYVRDDIALDKAYQKVKTKLSKRRDDDNQYIIPTDEEINKSFDEAEADIHRLAVKHVGSQVELAASGC